MSTFPADRPISTTSTEHDDTSDAGKLPKLDNPQQALAASLDFESFEALQGASTEVASNDGQRWFLTELKDGAWAVWNEKQLDVERHFANREEALASVPHETETAGKIC